MQQLINGLSIGSIYALFAIGFTLVFGVLDRLNLAHPSVFAVSAFIGIELVEVAGLSIWLTLPIVAAVGGVLTSPRYRWSAIPTPASPRYSIR